MPRPLKRAFRVSSAAVLSMIVTSAVWAAGYVTNSSVPPRGATPEFRDGYDDGCVSGYNGAGREGFQTRFAQDAARYASKRAYRTGWNSGYAACFEDQRRAPLMVPSR
jgi:hypothetical protein